MKADGECDWQPGRKPVVDTSLCDQDYEWMEEPCVSPDGEKIAAVVHLGDGVFSVCENGRAWEKTFDKIWDLKYGPDGRLSAYGAEAGEWTLAVEEETWEETYGFLWNKMFSPDGSVIASAVQKDMKYGMIVNGEIWPTLYENANNFHLSSDGRTTAAVVQTRSFPQADVEEFQKGCFSVAINGRPWEENFVNAWTPMIDPVKGRTAAQVRTSLYDYTIAVDGKTWAQSFGGVWEPAFNPVSGDLVAPVRVGGKWGLAREGSIWWEPRFVQCWHLKFSTNGQILGAIVATSFGRFTVALDNVPWTTTFEVVTDLALSPEGAVAAALGKKDETWTVMVNNSAWPQAYDMVFPPVVSSTGRLVGAKVEKNGSFTVAVNGKEFPEKFDRVFDPIFSPDETKVLIRGIQEGQYIRIVAEADMH